MHGRDIRRYEHTHIFHYQGTESEQRTLRVVLLTALMMAAEIVAGWLFRSMALLADGWHMSTHAAALGIAWGAFVLARRHALDRRFSFGTWKIEILGGFVSGILLGLVALAMLVMSLERLLHPAAIRFNEAMLVAGFGLAVNLISLMLLKERHHGHAHGAGAAHEGVAGEPGNLNLRAAYLHVLADALTSVLAIGALAGGKYADWVWLDPAVGVVGAILIGRWTVSLLKDTGAILLDIGGHEAVETEIRKRVESDGDTRVSDLHVWNVGQDRYACILALVAVNPHDLAFYRDRLRPIESLVHVTIEIARCEEPVVE